jgi:tetratricopeptide (TPR) repeat protein
MEAYRQAVEDQPESLSAHRKLGEEEFVGVLERMRRFNPNRDTARFRVQLGDLARRAGRTDEARHHYRRALANVPGHEAAGERLAELDRAAGS